MRNASVSGLLLLLYVLTSNAALAAEETLENLEERCRTYAKEDGIIASELDDYLKECVESLQEEQAGAQKNKE